MPNGLGGFGLPRYYKQQTEDYYANTEGDQGTDQPAAAPALGGPDQELSPTASEYKPKASA
jgi:hypothetical protein